MGDLVLDDLVQETTSSSGTADFTLSGAVSANYQRFQDVMSVGDWCTYEARLGSAREGGIGRLTASTTLERFEIVESSNADAKVNFSSSPNVYLTALGKTFQPLFSTLQDFLLNGNGQVAQIALGSTADDVYSHDAWYALTQTAALTTSQLTDVEDGLPQMMRLTQGQAGAQRIGYAQIVEGQRCKKLRGKRVTFGGRLRYSNAAAVRFAILEWTGTVDAVTSDVVNDWTNGTFTGGNFFNSTTLTVRSVGTITPAANTLTDWALTATLGSTFNNLIVMYWTEGTAAQNSTLDMACSLKRGFMVRPLVFRSYDEEYFFARRFFRFASNAYGSATLTTDARFAIDHPGMRATPTPAATVALVITDNNTANFTQSAAAITAVANTADGGTYNLPNFTGLTLFRPHSFEPSLGGKITLSARL